MINENTSLIEEKGHGYHGVGFETKINDKWFRCAVKLPLNATGAKWNKAWNILKDALEDPTKYKHTEGNQLLVGNEIELEDIPDEEIEERARSFIETGKEDESK